MDLGAATRGGVGRGEETITEDLLPNVKKAHPYDVIEYQFNKREEFFTGADWEWWLTDGRLWFGLRFRPSGSIRTATNTRRSKGALVKASAGKLMC